MEEKKFTNQIVSALIHFLYSFFIYLIFIVPFDLWKKATIRLSDQKEKGGLNISKSTSLWPFLSFLKTFILDFLIDGIIFISYVLGLIIGIYVSIESGIGAGMAAIAGVYFSPIGLSLLRDLLQLLVLPFKKFLSWASKPAQYLDLEIRNK